MISIVVVTHNRLDYTKRCIESIFNYTDRDSELIVIDSGSTDKTAEWLSSIRPGNRILNVQIEVFTSNVGAAIAYNAGFEKAAEHTIIRVDNDILVPPGWLSTMVAALESDSKLGMLSTELITDLTKESPGIQLPTRIDYFDQPVWHDAGLGSWCMAIRRNVFDQVGYYRDRFGVYALQDNDLEKRAQNAGWKIGYLHGLKVGHLYSMSTSEEIEYNRWKIAEYNTQIEKWNQVWKTQEGI